MATILIVDDNRLNREYLSLVLKPGGHRLREAGDGAEALSVIRSDCPDLVISDILMPTMDGYELLRQLRGDPAIAKTPVIFCTAHYHETEARSLACAWGVSDVLSKDCDAEVIVNCVQSALRREAPVISPPRVVEDFDRAHQRLLTDKLSHEVDKLRMANERLDALVELGLDLGSERDPGRLLQSFCERARKIIGARYAVVGILDGDAPQLRHCISSGMNAEITAQLGSPDPRHALVVAVLTEGHCCRFHNPDDDSARRNLRSPFPRFDAFLGAPIASPTRVYGWLCLLDKPGADQFSAEDERLAGILAAQVGRIYENVGLYADMSRQVSELERAKDSLRESEERSRLLLDSTAEAIYGIDLQRKCTFANPACARLLGFTESRQVVGKSMHALAHHTRRDGSPYPVDECPIYQAIARGEGCHVEDGLFWRIDGSSFPVEYWSYPIKRENKTIGAVVTFWDISEKMDAQETQRELAGERNGLLRKLQLQIERMPLAYVLFDADFRIIDWNPAAERIFGYAREEILGTGPPYEEFIPRSFWEKGEEIRSRIRSGEMEAHSINENLTKDGRTIICHWFNTPLMDDNGQFVGVLCLAQDVTAQKSLEAQFQQSQKMEAIGQLAGGVAHDFNNLLTVINGYSQLVMNGLPDGDATRAMLQEVVDAGDRAAGLTRQLLAFSRKAIIEPTILDLKALVADVDKMLRHIIGEDIQMSIVCDPEVGAVKADAGQIEQVLLNLVVNARDAMPKGGRLTIELRNAVLDETYARDHPDARAGRHVLLAASDTGCGIDEATRAKMFEPFFTTKGVKGTGLGLATVYGIVKQSGGHIAVYSEVGHGTTFKVYLPRVEQHPISGEPQPPEVLPSGNEMVLFVEDEDGVRALGRQALQKVGYTVLEARDGVEALSVAGQHQRRIDLLVTDVVMPRMGGREVAEQLATTHPCAKVLYLSGYTDDTVVRHGILDAQAAFLQKPFSSASLVLKVREVLDNKTGARP